VIKLTKAQKKSMWDCRVGYGVVLYKAAENTLGEFEFFIHPKDKAMHYITNGSPVEFDIRYDAEGNEIAASHLSNDVSSLLVEIARLRASVEGLLAAQKVLAENADEATLFVALNAMAIAQMEASEVLRQ
jgi:hypothetical protein